MTTLKPVSPHYVCLCPLMGARTSQSDSVDVMGDGLVDAKMAMMNEPIVGVDRIVFDEEAGPGAISARPPHTPKIMSAARRAIHAESQRCGARSEFWEQDVELRCRDGVPRRRRCRRRGFASGPELDNILGLGQGQEEYVQSRSRQMGGNEQRLVQGPASHEGLASPQRLSDRRQVSQDQRAPWRRDYACFRAAGTRACMLGC